MRGFIPPVLMGILVLNIIRLIPGFIVFSLTFLNTGLGRGASLGGCLVSDLLHCTSCCPGWGRTDCSVVTSCSAVAAVVTSCSVAAAVGTSCSVAAAAGFGNSGCVLMWGV